MEAHMSYMTLILEILKQRPQLQDQLRKNRKLLPMMEQYARELKESHLAWMKLLSRLRSGGEKDQISSEALELALKELAHRLPTECHPSKGTVVVLDATVLFSRHHTPHA
jgi:hypothetical protein